MRESESGRVGERKGGITGRACEGGARLRVIYLGSVDESLLDVGSRFGGCLEKDELVLVGKLLPLLCAHRTPVLQIALVADEHDRHV